MDTSVNFLPFGTDCEFTEKVLDDVVSKLPSKILPTRRSTIPLGFLKVMFRRKFSRYFSVGKISKKFLEIILRRVTANLRVANYGKRYNQNGGIFKTCMERYSSVPRLPVDEIQNASTYFLQRFENPYLACSLESFSQALTSSRHISLDELPLMHYILRRTCEGIGIELSIQYNCEAYTDEYCDCPKSFYVDDISHEFSYWRTKCFESLNKLLQSLDNFEQQLTMFPLQQLEESIPRLLRGI